MVKNNIVIKINDQIVDYDEDTAIGIDLVAYNPSEIDSIFLNTTNTFSLPITKNNKKIFSFAENTCANPSDMYKNLTCGLFLNGISVVLNGNCYVESIDDRYNVQFIEGKNVFDLLKELPFVKLHSDDYPDSLVARIAYNWNTVELPKIITKYSPSVYSDYFDAVLQWCCSADDNGAPLNDFCIPVVKNLFAEKQYHYNNDGGIDSVTNNIRSNSTSSEGYGFVVGKSFSNSPLTNTAPIYYNDTNNERYGQILLSPFWVSIERIISLLESYTGYTFVNLGESIQANMINSTDRLFIHIPAMEFYSDEIHYIDVSEEGTDANYQGYIRFEGRVQVLKGDMSWYGYKFDDGSISDIYSKDLQQSTCLDLLKSLMQENNLTVDVDNIKKTLTFKRLEDIKTEDTNEMKLVEENKKQFYIDGINQSQAIGYTDVADGTDAGSLEIVCDNKNIDEGSTDDKLVDIERYLFAGENYHFTDSNGNYGYHRNIPTITNDANTTNFVYGIPMHTTTGLSFVSSPIKDICISYTWFMSGDNPSSLITKKHFEIALYASQDLELFNDVKYINSVKQYTVSNTSAYDYYQELVAKPIYEEVTVKKDLVFLHNWKSLRKVHITGLTGNWYVQEIDSFNPRTDDTMKLKIIKLPADYSVYYTLNLSVSPEDSGVITPESGSKYAEGETVRVTATAYDGYWFKNWNDGVLSHIRDVYMDSNKNLVANFGNAPQGYTRLEYIGDVDNVNESFIDLGFVPTSNTVSFLDYEFSTTLATPNNVFYGYYQGVDTKDYRFFIGYFDMFAGRMSFTSSTISTYFRGRHTIELGNFYVKEGTTLISRGAAQTVDTTNNMCLFGDTSSSSYSSGRVYSLKTGYYESDGSFTIEHNFIPVKKDSNSSVGFYDIANDEFYPASGSIVYGPEVQI